jgi:IS5 family transposase
MNQLSFADTVVQKLGGQRTSAILDRLDASVDWRSLAEPVRRLYRNDAGGAPAEPVVLMLKILMLQKWFNLSDPQAQEQLNDRLSFRRFVGLRGEQPAPDETTIVKFRKRLREAGAEAELFALVGRSIAAQGLLLKEGTMVDAMILEAPRGRPTGETAESGRETTTRDTDAGFTQKHGKTYHGYKGHLAADRCGVVTGYAFSTASHHDSRYIDQLIEEETKAVLADAAYAERERRERLAARGVIDGIAHKRVRGQKDLHPLVKRLNRMIASLRAEVEHTIARCRRWGLSRARYRGERRNAFDFVIGLVAHNIRRATWLAR